MTDVDNRWPKLEQAQEIQVTVITDHPGMTGLAISCGPFFKWMHDHDHPGAGITWSPNGSQFTIAGVTYDLPSDPA